MYTNSKRFFFLFYIVLSIFLLFNSAFIKVSLADLDINVYGFEDDCIYCQSTATDWLTTYNNLTTYSFNVTNNNPRAGNRCFYIDFNNCLGHWHLDYPATYMLQNCSWYIYAPADYSSGYPSMYIDFNNANNDTVIRYRQKGNGASVNSRAFYSITTGWMDSIYNGGSYKFIRFWFHKNDSVYYTYGDVAIYIDDEDAPFMIAETLAEIRITDIWFHYGSGTTTSYGLRIDDINFTFMPYTDLEGYGGAGYGNQSGAGTGAGYNKIGSASYDSCWRLYTSTECVSIVENQYDIPMTADFHTFVYYVCYGSGISGEYDAIVSYLENTKNYIGAYLNGHDLGTPDFIEPIGATPTNKFRYIWNFDTISIQNEKIETEVNFAYINEHADPNFPYFKMGYLVGATGEDLDGDGDVCFSYIDICNYDESLNWVDAVFNTCGGLYLICSSVGGNAWEPAYELYYSNLSIVSDELTSENDTLDVYGYIGNSYPTNGLPYYKINSTVTIGYILSTMVDITYLRVYYNDGSTDIEVGQEQGYPITLFSSSRTYGFIPITTGYYNASLYRLGVRILNESFYVIDNTDNYYIYSYPNPSDGLNSYKIGYYFHNPSALDGFLAVFRNATDINTFSKNFYAFYIESNSSGIFTFYPSYFGTQYWQLFANRSGVYLSVGSMHPHISLNQFLTGGKLFILKENIAIDVNEFYDPINQPYILNTQYQTVSGYHTYVNAFTVIKINGAIKFDVSNAQLFNITYIPTIKGINVVTLEIFINNSWVILDTGYYNVTTGIEAFGEPPSLFPKLSPEFAIIVSTIVITSFLLMPMLIALSFKKSASNVPSVVYVICGGMGIAICTVFGLLPLWVPFFLVIIGIVVLTLLYLRGGQ